MKVVDIIMSDKTETANVATVTVTAGKLVVLDGDERLIGDLGMFSGVIDRKGKRIMPKDPGFLDALHVAFSDSRLRATKPYETEPGV